MTPLTGLKRSKETTMIPLVHHVQRRRAWRDCGLAACFGAVLLLCGGCSLTSEPPAPPPPSFAGQWSGVFEMGEVKLGGVWPVAAHPVELTFRVTESEGRVVGTGSVTNLMGDLSALAFISGPQRGEAMGVILDGVAEITLAIPPFGAPPAPASVLFNGRAEAQGLVGTCWVNLAGSESAAVPCTLTKPAPPPSQADKPEAQ